MATPNIVPRADQEGGLGTSAKSWGKIFIENPTDGGTAAATISNLDVDQIALDINANNTTANIIDVSTSALTTGSALNFDVTDTVTGTATANIIEIDYDKSGVVTASSVRTVRGIDINLADSATNNGSGFVQLVGQKITLNNTNDTGTIIHTGLEISATGGDASQTHGIVITTIDGGTDLSIRSSADSGDKFTIATTAAGATTISTIDDDATAAHFEVAADGNIVLDAAGTVTFEQGANSASMPASDGKVVVQTTTMKVMPQEFIANGDSGRPALAADQQTNKMGIHQYAATDELYAHVEIPYGHTVTHVQVHMSSNVSSAILIMSYNFQTGATDAVTSTAADGNENKALNANAIAGSANQDLLIKADMAADNIYLYGATVTLAVT